MIKVKDINNFYMLRWLDEYMIGHKGFIAGGCFKNIFNNEKVKDLDIFFRCESDWNDAVLYYEGLCGSDYSKYYENEKVKAYKNIKTGIVLELCRSVFGTPEEVLSQFDFTITKFAYYKEEVEEEIDEIMKDFGVEVTNHIEYRIIHVDTFFEHLHLHRLVTDDNILYPMSTFERMIRYSGYGYKPCRETKIKIVESLRRINDDQVQANNSFYDGVD